MFCVPREGIPPTISVEAGSDRGQGRRGMLREAVRAGPDRLAASSRPRTVAGAVRSRCNPHNLNDNTLMLSDHKSRKRGKR